MGRQLIWFADAIDRAVRALGYAAGWLALFLMAVIVFDVVTRRFLVLGSVRLQEAEWHLHGVLVLCALSYAQVEDLHVRIGVFRDRLSASGRLVIEVAGTLLLLVPGCLVLLWYGWTFFQLSYSIDEGSSAFDGIPNRWAIKFAVLVGVVLLLLTGLTRLLRSTVALATGRLLGRETRV